MKQARVTLGLMLGICGVLSGCSTESSVQRDLNPAMGSTTGGDNTAMTGGMQGGNNGAQMPTIKPGDMVDLDGDGMADDGIAVDSNADGVADGVDTTGDGVKDVDLPGAGGNSGNGNTGTGPVDDAGQPIACTPGPTPGGSVLLIGDSYVAINNNNFGKELMRLARAAGALGATDVYKDRSISGTQMVGGIFPIPGQYDGENNSDGHIKTVIMDGGGNDVLVGNRSCIDTEAPPANQSCVTTVNNAVSAAKTLLAKMANDGVEDVVYFFYPHLPGGDLGGKKELENATVDYAIPLVKGACDEAPLNCVFVDTRGLFGDAVTDFQDGVHPTVENNNKIAGAVWAAMMRECIAQ